MQLPVLGKIGFKWRPVLDFRDPALIETLKIAIPTLIFIVANLVAFSCRNAFSLICRDEGPSMLTYAWMWFQLPYGVVAVSLSRAMFTEQSAASAKEDWDSLKRYIVRGIRGTLFLIIPLAGLMLVLSVQIIGVFRAGAFTEQDVVEVAHVLWAWVLGLPMYSVYMYLYNTFASMRRFMPFALLNCALVAVQVVLYAVLTPIPAIGIVGIPIADLVYYILGAVLALILLYKMLGKLEFGGFATLLVKTVVATAAGMAVAWLALQVLPFGLSALAALAEVIVSGLAGLAVALLVSKLLGIEEMEIADRFRLP